MAHTELDLRERRAIENMLNAKMPVSKIASRSADIVLLSIERSTRTVLKTPNCRI